MIKKLQILILLFLFAFSLPLAAQYSHVEFSYQSFRPFVHFQLDFDSHGYSYHDSYRSAYLKGYMDGVNDSYYYQHRFADLVRDRRIYEAGYRDGLRDQRLMIRLRGRSWYHRHRFHYNDYYSPSYSVRIWLDGLSLAFLHAPAYRLPKHWKRYTHPHFKAYRKWASNKHYYKKKYKKHYRFDDVERRFKKRIRNYRKRAVNERQRYRKSDSYDRDNRSKSRYRQNRFANPGKGNSKFKRSHERKRKAFKHSRRTDRRKAVGKSGKRQRSRGAVKQKRGGKKEKNKGSRSRKRGKRGDGN